MMKLYALLAILLCLGSSAFSQETFESEEGDTTYLMQKYFVCFLTEGPMQSIDSMQRGLIIRAHLEYLSKLDKKDKISIAGPFDSKSKMKGIVIYHVATIDEAWKLTYADPAVSRGVFKAEILAWWAAKGSRLK